MKSELYFCETTKLDICNSFFAKLSLAPTSTQLQAELALISMPPTHPPREKVRNESAAITQIK